MVDTFFDIINSIWEKKLAQKINILFRWEIR